MNGSNNGDDFVSQPIPELDVNPPPHLAAGGGHCSAHFAAQMMTMQAWQAHMTNTLPQHGQRSEAAPAPEDAGGILNATTGEPRPILSRAEPRL